MRVYDWVMLAGVLGIILGAACGLSAFWHIDSGPDWLTSLSGFLGLLLFYGGIIALIFGAGMWITSPHIIVINNTGG